jgi:hypothetical protein
MMSQVIAFPTERRIVVAYYLEVVVEQQLNIAPSWVVNLVSKSSHSHRLASGFLVQIGIADKPEERPSSEQ